MFSSTRKSAAQGFVELPSNLKAQWQGPGAQVNTLYPVLSWDNPAGIGASRIKNVYVKVQADSDARGCDENTIIEHVFTTDNSFSPPCNLSEKSVFARGNPPNSYIVPPGKLSPNLTYYYSVWVETTNGQLYSSTGFRSGTGGNYTTNDYFTVNLSGVEKHIWGSNVYPNSQFAARGLDSQEARFNLIDTQLDWARLATGKGSWTKVFFFGIDENTVGALPEWKRTVQGIYEREMIPVVRMQGPWVASGSNALGGYYAAPNQANEYRDAAQAYKRVIADLPKTNGAPLFIEIYNELPDPVNWGGFTGSSADAEKYAKFFMAVKEAVAGLGDARIKVVSGALARSGDVSFLKKLVEVPGFAQAATEDGYWAVHVYTWGNADSDPAVSLDDPNLYQIDHATAGNLSPLGYKYQLDILARAGIDAAHLKVIVTKGGFRSPTPDREEERTRKTLRLYEILRADKAHIEGVSLFALTQPVDPLDRSFAPTGPYSGYDFGYYWVDWNSGTDPATGRPTSVLPVYNLVSGSVNPGDSLPQQEVRAIGYTVSEDPLIVNTADSPAIVSSTYPARIIYEFADTTPGPKNLFVKYFYSNGKTFLTQTPIIFAGVSPTPSPTPQVATPTPVSGPAYTTPVSDTNHCAGFDGKGRKLGRETGIICEGWVASNKSCALDLENPYYFNICKLVGVGPTPTPLSDPGHCANFAGKRMIQGKPSGITCAGWVQENKSCAQDAENPYYFNSCTGTIGNQPPSQVVTPIGYSLSEDGVALQNESSPQVSTTTFPASVGFSLSGKEGVRDIFVKYYYSNGQSLINSTQVNYRTSTAGAPKPDSVTPRAACPGSVAACGNESYGNLSSCNGTWSYAGNSDWNAWCLENAGGVDAYCYQCNPASYATPGYVTPAYSTPGQYSTPGSTPIYSTPPESQGSCAPSYNPPGLLCNSVRSDGAWSSGNCGCRNYYYTTFTGTYNAQQYTNDTSLNCQQPTMVETKSC